MHPVDRFAMKTGRTIPASYLYEIRVASHLSEIWAARFEGLSMRHEPEGKTVLSGILDQAALHGVFVKIRNLGLTLVEVKLVENPISIEGSHKKKGEINVHVKKDVPVKKKVSPTAKQEG